LFGKEIFVKYKRGGRKENQGKTATVEVHTSTVDVNYSFVLSSKMFYDNKNKVFDAKSFFLEIDEVVVIDLFSRSYIILNDKPNVSTGDRQKETQECR